MANILITGSNSGFGLLATKRLLADGHTVVASMRDPKARNRDIANELIHEGAKVVEIDVTDDESVIKGVALANENSGGLDTLINNAGVGVNGIQESFNTEDIKRVFDINVFGVHRMIRAVLPFFHKQNSGLILNVSSILGRMTIPFYGPYNATKWALEAMTENYRTELSALGIDVALIEPGGFPTAFIDRLIQPSDVERLAYYGDMANAPEAALEGFEQALAANPAQAPELVANAIANVVKTKAGHRPFRTVVDKMGMGEPVEEYNQHLHQVTEGVYQAFGTDSMLTLNTNSAN